MIRAIAVLLILGELAVGCRSVDEKRLALLKDEIATLGTAAKVGLTPSDMAELIRSAQRGDVKGAALTASKGLRTPAAIARIDADVAAAQKRADEVAR